MCGHTVRTKKIQKIQKTKTATHTGRVMRVVTCKTRYQPSRVVFFFFFLCLGFVLVFFPSCFYRANCAEKKMWIPWHCFFVFFFARKPKPSSNGRKNCKIAVIDMECECVQYFFFLFGFLGFSN